MYEEVITGRTAKYGADHVDTLTAKLNLGNLLKDQGQTAEAKRLRRRHQGRVHSFDDTRPLDRDSCDTVTVAIDGEFSDATSCIERPVDRCESKSFI
eukprot:SAG22_NODE_348_length_11873_cov_4.151435_6_plen_97_part_00